MRDDRCLVARFSFRSDTSIRTDDWKLFGQSNGEQKAGMLNHLLSSVGPGAVAFLAGGGMLSRFLSGGATQVTAEQAQNISPDTVQQLASHVEKSDLSIVDKASSFYSQHPALVKTFGAGVLSVAMVKLAHREAA
jgi:hypothetical protein